jgi:hypothetical protein
MSRIATLSLVLVGLAAPLHAQSAGDGYLFGAPDARFSLHAGYAHASANSAVFDDATRLLTLNKSSFSGPSLGGDLAVTVAPRLDLTLSAAYSSAVAESEDRTFAEGPANLPIQQSTSFRRAPLTANAILYLAPRGRSIGSLAWIPARVVPWIGAGGGTMWYRFQQEGDFVDYLSPTNNIITKTVASTGWAPALQGLGGVDVTLTPHVAFTADARYTWAKATMSSDFVGYDKIDLSGVTAALGFTVRL